LSSEALQEAIVAILAHSQKKQRKFVETIELQVALKNYDPNKDKRFSGTLRLPIAPRQSDKFKVCIIGDAKHIEEAKQAGVPSMSQDDLKKLKKDKKLVKKLAGSYDAFLASSSLIRMIPRLVVLVSTRLESFLPCLVPATALVRRCCNRSNRLSSS